LYTWICVHIKPDSSTPLSVSTANQIVKHLQLCPPKNKSVLLLHLCPNQNRQSYFSHYVLGKTDSFTSPTVSMAIQTVLHLQLCPQQKIQLCIPICVHNNQTVLHLNLCQRQNRQFHISDCVHGRRKKFNTFSCVLRKQTVLDHNLCPCHTAYHLYLCPHQKREF
jgi:hypothetical protein